MKTTRYLHNQPIEGRKRSDTFKGTIILIAITFGLMCAWYVTKAAEIPYSHFYYEDQQAMR